MKVAFYLEDITIFLTGGTGFLGSALLRYLIKTGAKLIVLKRAHSKLDRLQDILSHLIFYDVDRIDIDGIFQKHKPDIIIHCATNYGTQIKDIADIIDANLILPLKLLEAAFKAPNKPLFINTDTILDRRINAYSLSKKQFLEWLESFSIQLPCINIALEHFYGPLDNRSKFCTKVIMDLLNEVDHIDFTPGQQKRDFIFVDDVVSALVTLIQHGLTLAKGFHSFEVGTGTTIKIQDFILLAQELTANKNTKLNFGELRYRAQEVMESKVNLDPLLALDWKPKYNIKEGLLKTIAAERTKLTERKK